jgi:hypothetical protein
MHSLPLVVTWNTAVLSSCCWGNVVSFLQPMDEGVIKTFKFDCTWNVYRHAFQAVNSLAFDTLKHYDLLFVCVWNSSFSFSHLKSTNFRSLSINNIYQDFTSVWNLTVGLWHLRIIIQTFLHLTITSTSNSSLISAIFFSELHWSRVLTVNWF